MNQHGVTEVKQQLGVCVCVMSVSDTHPLSTESRCTASNFV